jgi:hypothetical protein
VASANTNIVKGPRARSNEFETFYIEDLHCLAII